MRSFRGHLRRGGRRRTAPHAAAERRRSLSRDARRLTTRIGFVGVGAIGTLFAAALAERHDVRALVRDASAAHAIARRGGLVVDAGAPRAIRASIDSGILADVEIVAIAVKTYATIDALRPLRGSIAPNVPILSLQNGAAQVEQIEAALGPRDGIALALTTEGALLDEPGVVRRIGVGRTRVGWAPRHDGGDAVRTFVAALEAGGIPASVTSDVESEVWAKLVVNAAINPVGALSGVTNGEVLARPVLWERAMRAAREAAAVARGLGIALPFDDPEPFVAGVARSTGANRSSMLRDLERTGGPRRTEIDDITGVVVRRARSLAIDVPESARLLDEVHARTEA